MRLLSLGPAVSCSQRQICPCADLRCGTARAVNISLHSKLLHVVRNLLSWERRCELKCDMMTAVRVGYQTLSTSVLHRLQKSNKMNKLANSLSMTIPHRAPQAERFQASPLHRAAAETFQFRLDLSGKFDEEFAICPQSHLCDGSAVSCFAQGSLSSDGCRKACH